MYRIVLLRHGESIWNKENRFTGWTDVDLSERGEQEAVKAGKLLQDAGLEFDICYTSVLKRSIRTLWAVLDVLNCQWLPVVRDWRLNERHYGALQGLNKQETAARHGDEQVHIWRRAYDIRPPLLTEDDDRFPGKDRRYSGLPKDAIPIGECLKDTVARFLPMWHDVIAHDIKSGRRVLIVAHGNSIRALCKYLDNIADDEIAELNIPTGVPLIYELDNDLKPMKHYYLGDQDEILKSIEQVKNQGKA